MRGTGTECWDGCRNVKRISCWSPIMLESYNWEIGKEGNEAVVEIEEMGKEARVPVNPVLLQGHPA